MRFERLLAKGQGRDEPWREQMWLPAHLVDVYLAADEVLRCTADDQLRALGVAPESVDNRFRQIVKLAAALHDLGKANNHFQEMLRRSRTIQGLRHEWVTIFMLTQFGFREWLRPIVAGHEADWSIVLWAIAGHHPAYDRPSPPRAVDAGAGDCLECLVDHADFGECLVRLQGLFGLGPPPEFQTSKVLPLVGGGDVFTTIAEWFITEAVRWEQWRRDPQLRGLVAATKNCLVSADVAGSALPRQFSDLSERNAWIRDAFSNTPPPDRIRRIVQRRLNGAVLKPFQIAVANSTAPVTLVRGGCGSGKTLAAYLWAATQYPTRRLYFCYPTTGTATEGYRDYLHAPEEKFDAAIFHGRADVDREIILGTGNDSQVDAADANARIESLDAWATPIVSCTVDTVLGLMQNNRKGRCAWPALAGSAVIFDEVHAYDDRLFGSLLRFLQSLPGVPVLLMTATLQDSRLTALTRCLRGRGCDLQEIAGPADLESRPRYHRLLPLDHESEEQIVRRHMSVWGERAKVLWVCNTVGRAMRTAEQIVDLAPLVYHSRFRYEDRVRQHQRVIDAFKEAEAAIVVCTQVAEMSLDLSASLLVTDLCPVPAAIQRLGRLNRRALDGDRTCPFVVVEADTLLPYNTDELDEAREWLIELGDVDLSQAALATAWQSCQKQRRVLAIDSAWLDGGPRTTVSELRSSSPGITVILQRDGDDVKNRRVSLARVALPMPPPPQHVNWRDWSTVEGVPVAPAEFVDYDPQRGAQWRSEE
jgi:CRISPR-associated endonuclease/helicase Cas3